MKKRNKTTSASVRPSKADELMETYRNLGFSPEEPVNGAAAAGNTRFEPVSFLPHVDYTISSVVGGF